MLTTWGWIIYVLIGLVTLRDASGTFAVDIFKTRRNKVKRKNADAMRRYPNFLGPELCKPVPTKMGQHDYGLGLFYGSIAGCLWPVYWLATLCVNHPAILFRIPKSNNLQARIEELERELEMTHE